MCHQVHAPKGLQVFFFSFVSVKLSYLWKMLSTVGEPLSHKLRSSFFFNLILFLNFINCISFAKYQNESTTGIVLLNFQMIGELYCSFWQ